MSSFVLLILLGVFVVFVIVLGIAMITEMGTKRKTGSMKSTKKQHKKRK